MNAPAGDASGRSRLDAAKDAVDAVLGAVPPSAPMGMRVYGARVAGQGRAAACADTELVAPVARGERGGLRAAAQALTGKGRTPIGASLLATPGDFPADGRRHQVVLVSDGLDNCSPPGAVPRRPAGRAPRRRADDLGRRLPARRARPAPDALHRPRRRRHLRRRERHGPAARGAAGRVRARLPRLRAGRHAGEGAPDPAAAPRLGAGLYQGELRAGAPQSFAVELAPGERLFAAATLIPPAGPPRLRRLRPRAARRGGERARARGDRLQRARHRRRADARR